LDQFRPLTRGYSALCAKAINKFLLWFRVFQTPVDYIPNNADESDKNHGGKIFLSILGLAKIFFDKF